MKRTNFLAAATLASVIASDRTALAAQADPIPGGRDLVERQANFNAADFDARLGKRADIRQLWESVAVKPAIFNNIKNALNGLEFGFGYPSDRTALAVASHGPSSSYTYSDAIWAKYRIGEFFNLTDKSGTPLSANIFYPRKNAPGESTDPNDEKGSYQDSGIEALQARGVIFLTCHTAVEEQSRGLVAAGHAPVGMNGSDVAADILTHLIPDAIVVPSMVATIAVLQHRFAYTYITIQS